MAGITEDILRTHEDVIMAAFFQGVTELDKQCPTEDELILYCGKVVRDDGIIDYVWRKHKIPLVILRVYPPQLVSDKSKNGMVNRRSERKIEQVWQKGQKGFH